MADRLPSDHDAVDTRRVPIARVGPTNRPQVELPADLELAADDVVRIVLDGTEYHGRIEADLDGGLTLGHVADNARLARVGEGENRLVEWVDDADVQIGGSAHFDVVTEGHKYGLRTPGRRVVYTATDGPDDALADIARDLEE